VWTAIMLARRSYRDVTILLSSGGLAGVLSLPYLLSLMSGGTGSAGTAETLFTFSVRRFGLADDFFAGSALVGGWPIQGIYAALLPLNYFLELGFFFAIAWLTFRKCRKSGPLTRQQLALSAMLITSVVLCTFVRSSVIANNDLGWRGFLFAQFVLVLWAVDFWPEWPKLGFDRRITLKVMLMIGVYGTIFQVVMLRMYPVFLDQWVLPGQGSPEKDSPSADGQFGRRGMAMRRGYAELQSLLPEDATVQFNPSGDTNNYYGGMYAGRQVVAFDQGCGTTFGSGGRDCTGLISRVLPIFQTPAPEQPINLDYIDVLVFQDTDPVWADRKNWIWHTKPMVANNYFRAFATKEISRQQVPK